MVTRIHVSIILVVTVVNDRVRKEKWGDVWSHTVSMMIRLGIGSIVEMKWLNVHCRYWIVPSNAFIFLF